MSDTNHNLKGDLPGGPVDTKNSILEAGAAATQVCNFSLQISSCYKNPNALYGQTFGPTKSICAHLNAWHVYASDPTRAVEANHYCSHISKGAAYQSLSSSN